MRTVRPRSLRLAGALALTTTSLALLSACGGDTPAPEQPVAEPRPQRCTGAPGSITDLSAEPPAWRSAASGRFWTTTDGCLVRMDVLADYSGPDHCGWASARYVVVTHPPGGIWRQERANERLTESARPHHYVRDPEGVYNRPDTTRLLDLDATLPAAAKDSGLRHRAEELWFVPGDTAAVFVKDQSGVERWPLDDNLPLCD